MQVFTTGMVTHQDALNWHLRGDLCGSQLNNHWKEDPFLRENKFSSKHHEILNSRSSNSVKNSLGSRYRLLSKQSPVYTADVFLKSNAKIENLQSESCFSFSFPYNFNDSFPWEKYFIVRHNEEYAHYSTNISFIFSNEQFVFTLFSYTIFSEKSLVKS